MFRDSFVPPAPSDVERRISQMAKVIPSTAYASEENETTKTPISTKGNDDEEEDTTVVEVASVVEEDDDDDSFLPRQDRLSKRMTMTGAVVSDQYYDNDEYETEQDEVVEEEVEEDDESTTSEESSNVQEEEEEEEEESYREPSDDGDGSLDLESQQQQDNQEQPQSTTRSFPGERVNKPEPTICDSCLNALTSLPVVTLIILLLITVLGAGIGVGVASRNDSNDNGGSSGDDDNLGPLEDTTPFNPTIGDPLRCQLALEPDLPSVYDQCLCRSEIATIPIDVQERYNFYREELIPRIYRNFNEEISSCSARNQALVWLSSGNNGSYETPELLQRYALATTFHGMGGGAWQRRVGWTSYFESCTWINVVCNADGLVQGLELANNSLLGSIPLELALLQGSLTDLNLSANGVSGSMPQLIADMPELVSLTVASNAIRGRLPSSFGSDKLEDVDLSRNQFEGTIPEGLGDLSNLQILQLDSNNLIGTVPDSLGRLSSLLTLSLDGNNLTGTMSQDVCDLRDGVLGVLSVDCGEVECEIPACCTFCR